MSSSRSHKSRLPVSGKLDREAINKLLPLILAQKDSAFSGNWIASMAFERGIFPGMSKKDIIAKVHTCFRLLVKVGLLLRAGHYGLYYADHEAVRQELRDTTDTVLQEIRKIHERGYLLGHRGLRTAMMEALAYLDKHGDFAEGEADGDQAAAEPTH